MWGYPKITKLNDGTEVILRVLSPDLRNKVVKFFRNLSKDDRLLLRNDVTDVVRVDERLNTIDYHRLIPLVAEYKGEIVADATLEQSPYGWTRHISEFRVVVARPFQKKGLAALLATELIYLALEKQVEKVEARLAAEQTAALKLCKKLGFKKIAVLPGYVKDLKKKTHDLVILELDLISLRPRMEDEDFLPSRY